MTYAEASTELAEIVGDGMSFTDASAALTERMGTRNALHVAHAIRYALGKAKTVRMTKDHRLVAA